MDPLLLQVGQGTAAPGPGTDTRWAGQVFVWHGMLIVWVWVMYWKGYHKKDRWFKTTSKVLPMSNTIFAWYIECCFDRCVCRTRLVASNHQCFHPFDKIMMNYINLYYNPLFSCPCPFLVWVVSHEPERGKRSFICNLFLGLAHMSNSISIRYVHKALTEHRVILKSQWWIIHFISLLKCLFGGIPNFQTNPVELPSGY